MPVAPAIQAVTFDVGNTLIKAWPSVGHVYAEIALRNGCVGVTPELLEARFRAQWPTWLHLTETRSGWQQIVDQVFEGLAPSPPSRTFFAELYDRFTQADVWRIYDDVLPALDLLAGQGLRLGIISNWDERLRVTLRNFGLDARFETIVVSCEVGYAKPRREIFDEAARRFGLPAGRILHVGDSVEMDVQGARAAGFEAVQILRGASEPGADWVRSLVEVAGRVRGGG